MISDMETAIADSAVATPTGSVTMPAASRGAPPRDLPPPATWPLWRFAVRRHPGRWHVAPAVLDEELVKLGYSLGSPWRSAAGLSAPERAELLALMRLGRKEQVPAQTARELALLGRCPFVGPMPPIDLDASPRADRATVLATARALGAAAKAHGLGRLCWYDTGGSGLHADQFALPECADLRLLGAYGVLVGELARACGVPLLSEHRETAERPPVVVDDTLFERLASSRGVVWRLVGSRHSSTGNRKVRLTDRQLGAPNGDAVPADAERLAAAAEAQPPPPAPHSHLPHDALERAFGTDVTRAAADLTGALPTVAKLLAQACPCSGQRHLARRAAAGWLLRLGVPQAVATATLAVLGDAQDAAALVATTARRLDSSQPCDGRRSLARRLGRDVMTALDEAFRQDLAAVGVDASRAGDTLTKADRDLLREAGDDCYKAGKEQLANKLYRAARCGIRHEEAVCEPCALRAVGRPFVSEDPMCPHCAMARQRGLLTWMRNRWPAQISVVVKRLAEDTAAAARAEHKRAVKYCGRSNRQVRWLWAPGYVAAVTWRADDYIYEEELTEEEMQGTPRNSFRSKLKDQSDNVMQRVAEQLSDDDRTIPMPRVRWQQDPRITWREDVPLEQGLELLTPILRARGERLRRHLRKRDKAALIADAWSNKVVACSAGTRARFYLPWPGKVEFRQMLSDQSRIRRGLPPLTTSEKHEEAEKSLYCPKCTKPLVFELFEGKERLRRQTHAHWTFTTAFEYYFESETKRPPFRRTYPTRGSRREVARAPT